MRNLLGLIFLLFISTSIFAQESIKGTILDSGSGSPLPGANVFLKSDWSIGTTTNAEGNFSLNIPNKLRTDSLIVSYVGYKEILVTLSKSKNEYEIQLEPQTQHLEASVVTARRIIAEEFTVKQIKQLDIYLNPAAKADPLLAINAMPASTTTDESASISLRGSRPDETGIFLNDVPIYDAVRFSQLNGIGTFSIFNTDIVERIHVFAGNPPLEYGNSASGLVSLQSHNNIPESSMNTVALSLANIGALTSRRLGEKTSLVAFGNYQPSQILTGLNQDALRDLESFNSYDLGFHIMHNVNSKLRFKLFNYSNSEGYEFNTRVPSYTGTFDMGKLRNFTVLNFISQYDKSEFTVNAGYNISKENYQYSITDIDVNKQDVYLSTNYQYFFNKWSLKTGASFDYRTNQTGGVKPLYHHAQDINHPSIEFDSTQDYYLPELFLYGKFNVTNKLILGTGIRKNVMINSTPNYFSYQGNLNYKFNEKHNLNVSAGHYNRLAMPNAQEYITTHYESDQYSVDYSYNSDFFELQTSVFKKDAKHGNYKDDIFGGEVYTKVIRKPFELQLSLTSLNANIEYQGETYPSRYDLDYFIRSVLKYTLKDFFEVSAIYIFRQGSYHRQIENAFFDNQTLTYNPVYQDWDNAERLPSYHKIDLTISKYWVVNQDLALVLYANVSNLLNTDNVMEVNYNFDYSQSFNELYSQRSFYFGASIMF